MVTRAKTIYLRSTIQSCPNALFLFGDNYLRRGLGGQAKECRGEPNTFGIITKLAPDNNPGSFMSDDSLLSNEAMIRHDVILAGQHYWEGNYKHLIILPMGVGLAKLPEKAPLTFKFLQYQLDRLEWMINRGKPS